MVIGDRRTERERESSGRKVVWRPRLFMGFYDSPEEEEEVFNIKCGFRNK